MEGDKERRKDGKKEGKKEKYIVGQMNG